MTSPVAVVPATSGRWPDLVALFDTSEVMRGCWCMWPRTPYGQMRAGPANEARLHAVVDGGTVPGLLAYADEVPVGWCSVGPRAHYSRFFDEGAEPDVWLIACLFIAASHRGAGVGSAMIEGAIRYASDRGARRIECMPRGWRPEDDPGTMDAILDMFRRAGFVDHAEVGAPARLRKDLTDA